MKRIIYNILVALGLTLAAVSIFGISVYAASNDFSDIQGSLFELPCPEVNSENEDGVVRGIYEYNDFLVVPVTYPSVATASRNIIFVYDISNGEPVLYTKWDMTDLDMTVRDTTDASKNDSIYGFAITDENIYTVVNLGLLRGQMGLYEYVNPLSSPSTAPTVPERLVSKRISASNAKCSIIETTNLTFTPDHANDLTVKAINGYLVIFYDINQNGQTGTVLKIVNVSTPKNPTIKAAYKLSAFTHGDITPTSLLDVVFDENFAYVLTKDVSGNYAVLKLDFSTSGTLNIVDAISFGGDGAEYAAINVSDGFGYITTYNENPYKTALEDGEYHLYTINLENEMSFIQKFILDDTIYYGNNSTGLGAVAVMGDRLVGIDGYGHRNGGVLIKFNKERTLIESSKILTDFAAEYKKNSNEAIVSGNRAYFAFKASQHTLDNCGVLGSFEFLDIGASWEEEVSLSDDGNFYVDFSPKYLTIGNNTFTVSGTNNSTEDMTYTVIAALFDGENLIKTTVSDPQTALSGEYFSAGVELKLDKDTDLSRAKMLVYIWDSTNGIEPLGSVYSQDCVAFTFTIDEKCKASAGVYDENDALIRTLWSARELENGEYTELWDGKDDDGNIVGDGAYTVKVLSNNVSYEHLDFAIGSTSDNTGTERGIYGYCTFFDMIRYGDKFYYATHYNENAYGVYSISVNSPTTKVIDQIGDYVNMNASRIATDGDYIYVAAQERAVYVDELKNIHSAFIYAHDMNDDFSTVTFDYGEHIADSWGDANGIVRYPSALNISQLDASEYDYNQIGGIEVSQNDCWLFSAYTTIGKLYVNDKYTGELVHTYDFVNPVSIDLDNDEYLWIAHEKDEKSIISKYRVNFDGSLELISDFPVEFDEIISIEVSPNGKKLAVVDAGNTNKLKVFSTETNELILTYGSGESYEENPTVKDDKLWFKRDVWLYRDYLNSFITFEDDNALWFSDSGNMRVLKLDISGEAPTLTNQIMYIGVFYNVELDANDETRLFADTMEYSLDYSKSGQDFWNLEKNYSAMLIAANTGKEIEVPFNNITTLSNGMSYFEGIDRETSKNKLYYITAEGKILGTGIDLTNKALMANGDLLSRETDSKTEKWYIERLLGFDESNIPMYDEKETIALISATDKRLPTSGKISAPITDNSILISLVGGNRNTENVEGKRFHLGGIALSNNVATNFKWEAMPETFGKYNGSFPSDGAVDIGNGVEYSVNGAKAIGKNIIISYRGEFYRQSQTNKFLHYYDNGLFIGEYGLVFNEYANGTISSDLPFIVASNALDAAVTISPYDSDTAYIFNNSEAMGGGVHIWKVTGLNSIKEQAQTVYFKSGTISGVLCEVYNDNNFDSAKKVRQRVMSEISISDMIKGFEGNRSFKFSGYITADKTGDFNFVAETDGFLELWVNGYKVISGTGLNAGVLRLEKGRAYEMELRVSPYNGTLTYVNAGRRVGSTYYRIGKEMRCKALSDENKNVINLLEGALFGETVQNGEYGWTYYLVQGNSSLCKTTIETNRWTYDRDKTSDFYITQSGPFNCQSFVERNLKTDSTALEKWSITANVRFLDFMARINRLDRRGQKIEILDENDRVIAWIALMEPYEIYANGKLLYAFENGLELKESISDSENSDFVWPNVLQFAAENGEIKITYKDKSVTSAPYDTSADITKPAKLRLNRYNYFSDLDYPSTVNFISLTFARNEIENVLTYGE